MHDGKHPESMLELVRRRIGKSLPESTLGTSKRPNEVECAECKEDSFFLCRLTSAERRVDMQRLWFSGPALAISFAACGGSSGTAPLAGVPVGGAALFQAQGARANDPAFMRLGADTTTEFKIYVACETGGVTTYTSTGKKTKPTIIYDISYPKGVAVDANGKIYVANSGNNTVTTYKSDGTPTVPIITRASQSLGRGGRRER